MTEPERNEKEIQQIAADATDLTYVRNPPPKLSTFQRVVFGIIAFLVLINSAVNAIDTIQLQNTIKCQSNSLTQAKAIAKTDRQVVDDWINNLTEKIAAKKLTGEDVIALTKAYNSQRAKNEANRAAQTASSNCH